MADDKGIVGLIKDRLDKAGKLFDGALSSLREGTRKVFPGLGDLFNVVFEFFGAQWRVFAEGIVSYFAEDIQSFRNFISFQWADVFKASAKKDINAFVDQLNMGEEEKQAFLTVAKSIENLPGVMQMVIWIQVFAQFVGGLGANAFGKVDQTLKARYSPRPADAGSVLRAAFVAPELTDQIWETLRKNGYSDEDIRLMYIASYAIYPIEVIRTLYFRGNLSESEVNNRLQEMGFTPQRVEEIKQTFPALPGIQDLVMMLAKEAFEPDQISKFGLGSEFPQELVKWTAKQGLSEDWAFKYWVSHWTHPSYQQMMEALHRGAITPETVYEWYRLVEIPPYWREMLNKISYSPYTRVDARRMYGLGVLTRDELKRSYLDMGYDEEHAEKLTLWTVLEEARTNRDVTKADIVKAYVEGDIKTPEAVGLLVDIGYTQTDAEFITWQAEQSILRDARNAQVEGIKVYFLMGGISEAEVKARLVQMGISNAKITALLATWGAEMLKAKKLPSKTDLDKWLRVNLINQARYYTEMLKLGYAREYIDLYYQYAHGTKGEL